MLGASAGDFLLNLSDPFHPSLKALAPADRAAWTFAEPPLPRNVALTPARGAGDGYGYGYGLQTYNSSDGQPLRFWPLPIDPTTRLQASADGRWVFCQTLANGEFTPPHVVALDLHEGTLQTFAGQGISTLLNVFYLNGHPRLVWGTGWGEMVSAALDGGASADVRALGLGRLLRLQAFTAMGSAFALAQSTTGLVAVVRLTARLEDL